MPAVAEARVIVELPAIVTDAGASVAADVLVKLAPVPLTPASDRTPVPIDAAVRPPPAPIVIVPELATLFVIDASRFRLPPLFTVRLPVPDDCALVNFSVPAPTVRLLKVFVADSVTVPAPLVVRFLPAPATLQLKISAYVGELLVHVWLAVLPRLTCSTALVAERIAVNVVSPTTSALTRMPVPAETPFVPVAWIVNWLVRFVAVPPAETK